MKKSVIILVFILTAFMLFGCGETDTSSGTEADKSATQPGTNQDTVQTETTANSEFTNWSRGETASDLNGDEVITEDDFTLWKTFYAWLDTADALDYTKDRKITFEDYKFFNEFKQWKLSSSSLDFNGDFKIDLDDYTLFLNPEKISYIAWSNSENAADIDGNGVINEQDYKLTEKYLQFIGSFRTSNWEIGECVPYFINSEFDLCDFAEYSPSVTFTLDKYGKANWTVPQAMREAIGNNDWALADNAVKTAVMEKISDSLAKIVLSSPREGVLTIYLATSETGDYSCSFSYIYNNMTMEASFDIVYE